MVTILAAVAAAAVTGLIGLFAVTAAGLIGLFAGVRLEHERSQEWAKKEGWAYKRQTYEETFNLLGEITWWLGQIEIEDAPESLVNQNQIKKRSQKLSGLLYRMEVFLNEEARKAVDDYSKKFGAGPIAHNEVRDAILVLVEKLVIAARTDLDFSSS